MAPNAHAILSPSKSHQWLECTPSAVWESMEPEEPASEAAEEGTLAHSIAEFKLTNAFAGKKGKTPKKLRDNPLYAPVMEEHTNTYVDTIMEIRSGMPADTVAYVEQQLDLREWVPDGFGTSDCVMIGDGVMHVCDLKYGKGVPVSAEDNPQLKLYALGCYAEFSALYDINDVVVHIIQPRLDSITESRMSTAELLLWGETVVKPRAQLAAAGEGTYNPSDDTCRWCRCKNKCRAYQEHVMEVAKLRFNPEGEERKPNELSMEEIGQLLDSVEELKRWATGVTEWALEQATNRGVKIPGWKLVEGRSVRKITGEDEVVTILDDAGYTTDKTCKLRGLTELESLIGKKELATLLGDHIIKPRGKPVLAHEDDKRPELASDNTAADVFAANND